VEFDKVLGWVGLVVVVALASSWLSGRKRPTPSPEQRPKKPQTKPRPLPPWSAGWLFLSGAFRVERELGRGGMGVVYLVTSTATGRAFAVKRLPIGSGRPEARAELLGELAVWLDLPPHPNLVRCIDLRTVNDDIVVFAEFVEGESLAHVLARGAVAAPTTALDIAIQLARALACVHAAGYVHQDVKPSNALLSADGTVKLTDFGISRAMAGPLPRQAEGRGAKTVGSAPVAGMTEPYASPEQLMRRRVTHRTDVWSWAVTALELFEGRDAWPASGAERAAVRERLRASGGTGRVPGTVGELLARCLAPRHQDREVDMPEAEELLIREYASLAGSPYPRPRSTSAPVAPRGTAESGPSSGVAQIRRVIESYGLALPPGEESAAGPSLGDRAGVAAELRLLELARVQLAPRAAGGEHAAAALLSWIHEAMGRRHHLSRDTAGAVRHFETASALLGKWSAALTDADREALTRIRVAQAAAYHDAGEDGLAVGLLRRAVDDERSRLAKDWSAKAALSLAELESKLAVAQFRVGSIEAAREVLDHALQRCESVASMDGSGEVDADLASLRTNLAVVSAETQGTMRALPLFHDAVRAWRQIVAHENDLDTKRELSKALVNLAHAKIAVDERREAASVLAEAISLREAHFAIHGSAPAATDLAWARLARVEVESEEEAYRTLSAVDALLREYADLWAAAREALDRCAAMRTDRFGARATRT